VSYLLDSHAFYWLLESSYRVPVHVSDALAGNRLYVSAISAYELVRKRELGKLHAPGLAEGWRRDVVRLKATELPLTTEHALRAATLDWPHRDPFDRLLAAQTLVDGLTLVTADKAFADAGIPLLRW
jgi:PIN domain nuclease of toxin-antitoxin system